MVESVTSARGTARDDGTPDWELVVGSIGPKVRELRQQLGLSLQQLAQHSEVSAAAIHKVERGDMVPTITTLLKLASALRTPIGHFVADAAPETPVASYIPAADRTRLRSSADGMELAGISGSPQRFHTKGALATIEPGAKGSGELYPGEDLLFVLTGTLAFDVAGEHYTLRRGDALQFPTDRTVHWSNPGRSEARVLWVSLHSS